MRHGLAAEAVGQQHMLVFALIGIDAAFNRRRGRGQHHGRALDPSAQHRHIAGMIMHAVFLLVGALMLFVDDDKTEIGERQKQCRAGTRHHFGLARGQRGIDMLALATRNARMPLRRTDAEAGGKAVEKLRGQGNFGYQNQGLASLFDRFGHRLEIDFGFARSRHPFQQGDRKSLGCHRLFEPVGGLALFRRQHRWAESRVGIGGNRIGRHDQRGQSALVDQTVDDSRADARFFGQCRFGIGQTAGGDFQHAASGRGQTGRRRAGQTDAETHTFGLVGIGPVQGHPQYHALGGQGVAGHPVNELA